MNRFFLLILLAAFISPYTGQADEFELVYKKQNRWVAVEDAAPLRALTRATKKSGNGHLTFQIPEKNRSLYIERLKVLRNILNKNTKLDIILEEITGNPPQNRIIVSTKPRKMKATTRPPVEKAPLN